MTASWVITFLLAFAVGPLVVLYVMRRPSDVSVVRPLGLITVVLVVMAISAPMVGAHGAISTLLLWASWVMSMCVMGHVMRLVIGTDGARRWTATVAAIGATIPWFGILIARAVAA